MPPPRLSGPPRALGAFTLIELLVSMTVLILVVLMINQLVNGATVLSTSNSKHLDADGQARLVFERMALDLAKMVKRTDADNLFVKVNGQGSGSPGDDKFFFYGEVPAFYDGAPTPSAAKSPVALLGYRINAAFQLERLGKVLTWDGPTVTGSTPGGLMFLSARPSPSTTLDPDPASTLATNWGDTVGSKSDVPTPYSNATKDDADYNVLGEQVFRMEICYFLRPVNHTDPNTHAVLNVSKYSAFPVAAPENVTNNLTANQPPAVTDDSSKYQIGSRWYDSYNYRAYICTSNNAGAAVWKNLGMQDVSGVVVALAVLDGTTGKILPTTPATLNSKQTQPIQVPNLSGLNVLFADVVNDSAPTPPSSSNVNTLPDLSITPPRLMAEAWRNELNSSSPTFAQAAGVPPRVASQVRIYQRFIPLNPAP